jgi:uncharacterized pyridoxal phosphate-containing UPF0001 family protein
VKLRTHYGARILEASLQVVRARIARPANGRPRARGHVTLLAVSKTFGAEAVRAAASRRPARLRRELRAGGAGQDRRAARSAAQLQWHCIGPLQSNKTRAVAEHFDWVHSVDRLKIAQRLSEQRPAELAAAAALPAGQHQRRGQQERRGAGRGCRRWPPPCAALPAPAPARPDGHPRAAAAARAVHRAPA